MLLVIHRKQPDPQQQARRQIKRGAALLLQPPLDHHLRITVARSFGCQVYGWRRVHNLNHLAPLQPKGSAQGGMALDQPFQSSLQGLPIQITPQPPHRWPVIRRELRLQLVQKPQARLGKRGLIGLAAWGPIARQRSGGGRSAETVGSLKLPQPANPVRQPRGVGHGPPARFKLASRTALQWESCRPLDNASLRSALSSSRPSSARSIASWAAKRQGVL